MAGDASAAFRSGSTHAHSTHTPKSYAPLQISQLVKCIIWAHLPGRCVQKSHDFVPTNKVSSQQMFQGSAHCIFCCTFVVYMPKHVLVTVLDRKDRLDCIGFWSRYVTNYKIVVMQILLVVCAKHDAARGAPSLPAFADQAEVSDELTSLQLLQVLVTALQAC